MIGRVAVVGAGVMGSEIAQAVASGGTEVVLFDADAGALRRGLAHIADIGGRRVARGRMTEDVAAEILARVTTSAADADLASCDLAIEAVPEIMDVKRAVFRRLDAALPAAAFIASNTSGLSISELAAETGRPGQVLGLHFFNPASVMRLVEMIGGSGTEPATLDACEAFVRALGKTPVRVRECPGFLVNRVLLRAMAEAYRHAVEIGADPAAADRAVVDAGPAPMGPFALGDLIGLDTLEHIRADLERAYGGRFRDGGAAARLVAAGCLGAKSGGGFFGGAPPVVPSDESGREVADSYYSGAIDEAHRCVHEDVAAPADVDLAMRLGCGWTDGPLAWAEADRPVAPLGGR